jgi:hypothetical protein
MKAKALKKKVTKAAEAAVKDGKKVVKKAVKRPQESGGSKIKS